MNHNNSIGCSVGECSYHCKDDNYCTLNKIEVSKDSKGMVSNSCATQCASFKTY